MNWKTKLSNLFSSSKEPTSGKSSSKEPTSGKLTSCRLRLVALCGSQAVCHAATPVQSNSFDITIFFEPID